MLGRTRIRCTRLKVRGRSVSCIMFGITWIPRWRSSLRSWLPMGEMGPCSQIGGSFTWLCTTCRLWLRSRRLCSCLGIRKGFIPRHKRIQGLSSLMDWWFLITVLKNSTKNSMPWATRFMVRWRLEVSAISAHRVSYMERLWLYRTLQESIWENKTCQESYT